MSVHQGHRQRLKERFINHGLDSFDDHNVLELLLTFSVTRRDVNPLAHKLIDHFGSLSAVFDADYEALLDIDGVGENTASLIKLMPDIGRRYQICKTSLERILTTTEQLGEYLLPRFFGHKDEVVYLMCLDAKNKVISCNLVSRGSVNAAHISTRSILTEALNHRATSVVLAHNHTSGMALPSKEDIVTTTKLAQVLQTAGIYLKDHLIVAGDDFVSLRDSDVGCKIFPKE